MKIGFVNRVNRTFYDKGVQTISTSLNKYLDMKSICNLNATAHIQILFPNGNRVSGNIYHGANNSSEYYQFKVIGEDNVKSLQAQIKIDEMLRFDIDPDGKCIWITRKFTSVK